MAELEPATRKIAAQKLTNRFDTGFIATAHLMSLAASAPGRIRKTLCDVTMTCFLQRSISFMGSKPRQNCAPEPDGKFPIC